jgi:hypothetical protein
MQRPSKGWWSVTTARSKKTSNIDKEVIVLTVILDVIARLDDNL